MIIYLAGGVSGNLNPAWKYMVKSNDISNDGFIKALIHEKFYQGMKIYLASPHTFLKFKGGVQLAEQAIWGNFNDENLSRGEHDISSLHRSDIIRRGG